MAIGIVRALSGTTTATDSRGNTRVLRVGDAVELNETIQASNGSTVLIQFDNGGFATVGSNDKLVLDQSVLDPTGNTRTAEAAGQSVEDIQAMIAAGMDPTQIAEATAAGADAGTAGDPGHSGSHSFVVVNQEGASAEVTPGFGTDTSAAPLNTAAAQTAEPRFFINSDTDTGTGTDTPPIPDVPMQPANNAPVITERSGDTLNLKEAGVGTVEQGGQPGWALGDHNHAIAGTPEAGGSFTVGDADGDALSARLVDGWGNPVEGVVTDPDTGVMTLETEYGTLTVTPTVNADGSVTYDYSFELNDNANSLNEGQSVDYEYKVEVSDGHGGTVSEDVHVKIDGTNDAPSIKFDSVHVKEEGAGTSGIGGNDGFVGDNHHRFVVHGDLSQKAGDMDAGDKLTYSVDIEAGEKNLETASTGGSVVTDADGNNVSVPVEVLSNTTENGIQTIVTNYGTFTLNTATGEYTFELNTAEGSPANNLAQGEFLNLGFTSTVTDLAGAIGNHTVRVTVEGSNDAPVLSKPDAVDVYQGGNDHSVEGQVIGSDADHGAKLTYSFGTHADGTPITEIETSYGTVRINPETGEYEYTLKPGATAEDVTDEFKVRVTDEHGAYDEEDVSVNIHGNRAPEVVSPPENADGLTVKESGQADKSDGVPDKGWAEGQNQTKVLGIQSDGDSFTVKDPDNGDKLKATLTDEHGNPVEGAVTHPETGVITLVTDYGTLTVTPTVNGDGSVTYDYQFVLNDNGKANTLAQGEELPLDFYIRVSDSNGSFVTQEVNVTIEGTNDGPKVSGTQVHVKEEGVYDGTHETAGDGKDNGNMFEQDHRLTVNGKVPVTDPDNDSVVMLEANLSDSRNTVNETTSAVFTGDKLTGDNATGATEKIVVNKSYMTAEEGNDHAIQVIETNYGTLRLDTVTGEYSFTLDSSAANHLAAGEKFVIDFRITATDQFGAQGHHDFAVQVTVEGANDAPILKVDEPLEVSQAGESNDDGKIVVSGEVHGEDADRGAKLTYSFGNDTDGNPVTQIVTSYGTVTIDQNTGKYTYEVNPNAPIENGKSVTDEFKVRVTDEHGACDEEKVSVNVHANQAPEIVGEHGDSLSMKEAGVGTEAEGGKPGWAMGEHNHVIAGNKEAESSFTVRDADGNTLKASLLDKEGNPLGNVHTDDSGKMTVQTEYGILTVTPVENADGTVTYTYHYELDDKLSDSLDQGDSVHEAFQIQVSDGHNGFVTHPVDINIEGTNDAPTFNGRGQNVQLKEDGVFDGNRPTTEDNKNDGFVHEQNSRPKVEGDLSRYVTDADNDAELTYSVNHFNDKNTAVDSVETTLYTGNKDPVIDAATGKPVSVTVEMIGKPTIDDATGIQTIKTNYGTLAVDTRTGHYTFELGGDEASDKLVNSMAAGEKFTFQFETIVTDDHSAIGKHLLTVVIEGANDAPTFVQLEHNDYLGIEQPFIGVDGKWEVEAAEQGRWRGDGGNTNRVSDHSDVVTGSFGASDDDRGSTLTFSADFVNGTTSGPNKDALEQGNQADGLKPTSVDDMTLTAPKVLAEHADKGSDHYTELPAGTYKVFHFDVGDFYLDVNTGKYYFDVKDGNPMIDGMNLGDSHSLNFNVTVTDEHGASSSHDFTINITGRNDRPELSVSDTPLGVTAGSDVHGNLLGDNILSVADDDINDTHTFHIIANPTMNGNNPGDYEGRTDNFDFNRFDSYDPVTQLEGKYGVLTIDPGTGDYTYRLYGKGEGHDDAWQLVQSLGKDGVLTDEVFHIGVKDSYNAFDIKDVHITVNGNEQVPSVDPVEGSLIVNEAGLNNPADGSDVAVLKLAAGYEIVESADGHYGEGMYGKLVQNAQGQWEYRLEQAYAHAADNNFASTAEGADSITIQVKGPNGQIQDVTVKVDIVDDVPTVNVSDNIDNNVVAGHDSIDGGKLDFDFSADNGEGKQLTVSVGERTVDITDIASKGSYDIAGQSGTLSLHADGTYTYHANPNARQGQDSFCISIKDTDGDTAQTRIDVNVVSATGPDGSQIAHITVNEAGLNDVVNLSETAAITAPDGYTIVSVFPQGEHSPGTVSQDNEGNWHYTLNNAIDSGKAQGANTVEGADTVRMTVQDEFGNQFQVNVNINIVDDVPQIDVAENGSILTGGQRIYDGSLTIDYGADGHSGDQVGADIRVQIVGSDFTGTFRVNADGSFINDSVDLMLGKDTIGKLELTAGKDGHYEYKFIPDAGHENDQVNIELSVRDQDGDTSTGTIVIDPAVPPVQENHAPEAGNVQATVEYANQPVHVDGTDRMIVHELLSHSTYSGVKVDASHDLFSTYTGMDLATVKAGACVIYDWQYSNLVNSADCPKVIWVDGSLPVNGSLKVPADTIVIVNGDLNINGSLETVGADIEGILFVKNNFDLNQVRFELQGDHTDTALILIQGKVQSNANINAQGTGDLDTSIPTDTEQVLIDLNKSFTDADGDRMTFAVDGRALPEGYTASVTDGVLTVTGKAGSFGHHAITVTATDDKGASTSVSFDINVSGHHANVTVSPSDHAATFIDPMMLSAVDTGTGAEHVTDAAGHDTNVNPSHTDGLEGMIAAADMIEHGTAGHDMLIGSHGHDVLYGEGGNDLMSGDGSGTTVDGLAGLVHTDSSSESVLNAIHSMSPEQLKGLSDGLETLEHHNDGNDVLMGGAGNDVLIGMGGNDVLHGGEGNDILLGGSGDDILVGGKGDDVLVGGSGHDTFQYHRGDLDGVLNGDHIADFHLGNLATDANADVLDIGDLLLGSGAKADGSDLFSGGFLQVEVISHDEEKGTAKVRLSIDQDGAAGSEHGSVALATIDMKGVHGLGGMNPQDQADHLMQQLMDNHALKM